MVMAVAGRRWAAIKAQLSVFEWKVAVQWKSASGHTHSGVGADREDVPVVVVVVEANAVSKVVTGRVTRAASQSSCLMVVKTRGTTRGRGSTHASKYESTAIRTQPISPDMLEPACTDAFFACNVETYDHGNDEMSKSNVKVRVKLRRRKLNSNEIVNPCWWRERRTICIQITILQTEWATIVKVN